MKIARCSDSHIKNSFLSSDIATTIMGDWPKIEVVREDDGRVAVFVDDDYYDTADPESYRLFAAVVAADLDGDEYIDFEEL